LTARAQVASWFRTAIAQWADIRDELVPRWAYDPPGQQALYDSYDAARQEIGMSPDGPYAPTLLAITERVYDAETARRESLNTRAGALIGTAGILGSLVVAAGQIGLDAKTKTFNAATWVVLFFFIVSLIYLGATLVLALLVHMGMQGGFVDATDLPAQPGEQTDANRYEVRLARVHLDYTSYNYKLNNELRYRLLSAQRCLRNGVLAVMVAGIVSPAALRA
jgi:hypothetical protein